MPGQAGCQLLYVAAVKQHRLECRKLGFRASVWFPDALKQQKGSNINTFGDWDLRFDKPFDILCTFFVLAQGKPGQAVQQRSQATTAMQTDIYQELRHRAYWRKPVALK